MVRPALVRVILPLLLVAISAVFRTVSLKKFGMLYDEQITRAVAANIWRGDLSNNWKSAPGVPAAFQINCYNFSSYMYADALAAGRDAPHPLFRERLFSAVLGSLAIVLFYFVALRLLGPAVALASLAVMAVFPLLVQDAHYARPEAFVTFLCGIVYVCSVRLLESPRPRLWLGAGAFCCGLLVACKISLIPIAAIPLVCLVARRMFSWRIIGVFAGLLAVGVFAGVPDAFLHPVAFLDGVRMLSHHYADEHPPHSLLDSRYCFALLAPYFLQTIGPACCALFFLGVVAAVWQREYLCLAIVAAPALFYLVYFSLQRTFFERNLSHVVPLIAILCGAGLVWVVKLFPIRMRTAAFAGGLLLTVLQPALISAKLVFEALRVSPEQRANHYEDALRKKEGVPIEAISELVVPGHADYLAGLVQHSAEPIIVPVRDYHDGYTRFYFHALQKRAKASEVGYFPSIFPSFSPNTILAYHSPNLLYIKLMPPDTQEYEGQTYVTWQDVSQVLKPPVNSASWLKNGLHPAARIPIGRGDFYGSFTPEHGDGNRGSIEIGPIDVDRPLAIGIPVITGPDRGGLSVSVVDHATGRTLAELNPPPALPLWDIWRVNLDPGMSSSVDVLARDEGAAWGEWLGIGSPVILRGEEH